MHRVRETEARDGVCAHIHTARQTNTNERAGRGRPQTPQVWHFVCCHEMVDAPACTSATDAFVFVHVCARVCVSHVRQCIGMVWHAGAHAAGVERGTAA